MIEPALRTLLHDAAHVHQTVDDRIFFGIKPQGERRPSLVITVVSHVHAHVFSGHAGWANVRFQVDCWAATYQGAKELAQAVRFAAAQFRRDWSPNVVIPPGENQTRIQTIEVTTERDIATLPLEGTAVPLYGVALDVMVMYTDPTLTYYER